MLTQLHILASHSSGSVRESLVEICKLASPTLLEKNHISSMFLITPCEIANPDLKKKMQQLKGGREHL